MEDEFEGYAPTLVAPALGAEAITPSDSTELTYLTRGIFVGQTGDLTVRMFKGETITLRNVQAGMVYALRASQVLASGTTASDLIGLR